MNSYSGRVLGELEREIMDFVWPSNQPVTVRSVFESISRDRKIAYTTVMTIMGRLVSKGVLVRKLKGSSYLYEPKVSKDKFVSKTVHNIFTSAVSSLGQEATTHFVKEIQKLDSKRRKELLEILDKE